MDLNEFLPEEFSLRNRAININNFKTVEYDLLIIGGGITGAGTACVAAQKGIKTALVEMNDPLTYFVLRAATITGVEPEPEPSPEKWRRFLKILW